MGVIGLWVKKKTPEGTTGFWEHFSFYFTNSEFWVAFFDPWPCGVIEIKSLGGSVDAAKQVLVGAGVFFFVKKEASGAAARGGVLSVQKSLWGDGLAPTVVPSA